MKQKEPAARTIEIKAACGKNDSTSHAPNCRRFVTGVGVSRGHRAGMTYGDLPEHNPGSCKSWLATCNHCRHHRCLSDPSLSGHPPSLDLSDQSMHPPSLDLSDQSGHPPSLDLSDQSRIESTALEYHHRCPCHRPRRCRLGARCPKRRNLETHPLSTALVAVRLLPARQPLHEARQPLHEARHPANSQSFRCHGQVHRKYVLKSLRRMGHNSTHKAPTSIIQVQIEDVWRGL